MASGRILLPGIADPCLSNAGALESGATLLINIAGGSTPAALFSDPALTIGIPNPQVSDSAGRFFEDSTNIWVDAGNAYDLYLRFPDGEDFSFLQNYVLGAQTNISGFAPLNSPALTGTPTAPTSALNDSSNKLATTGYVQGQGYAPSASPALTGVPTAPTAAPGTNTTQLATTAFVDAALGIKLPSGSASGMAQFGGLILQWTSFSLGSAGGASQTVTWPTPFPTGIVGTPWVAVANAALEMIGVTSATTTGATVNKGATDGGSARTGTVWAFGS